MRPPTTMMLCCTHCRLPVGDCQCGDDFQLRDDRVHGPLNMSCNVCNRDMSECKCPDRRERLARFVGNLVDDSTMEGEP